MMELVILLMTLIVAASWKSADPSFFCRPKLLVAVLRSILVFLHVSNYAFVGQVGTTVCCHFLTVHEV